jgi:hypothetical protein
MLSGQLPLLCIKIVLLNVYYHFKELVQATAVVHVYDFFSAVLLSPCFSSVGFSGILRDFACFLFCCVGPSHRTASILRWWQAGCIRVIHRFDHNRMESSEFAKFAQIRVHLRARTGDGG